MTTALAHSRFGGSKASRWMNCAGSVVIEAMVEEQFGASPTSVFAEDGNAAHQLGWMCLRDKVREAKTFLGFTLVGPNFPTRVVDKGVVEAVQFYLDAVYDVLDAYPDAILFVEHRFEMKAQSAAPGESFGTADALVYVPSIKKLFVFDYKNGVGMGVKAEDNAQEKFYGVGAAWSMPEWVIADIELTIVQPRDWRNNYSDEGEVRRWSMHPSELIEFADQIDRAILECKRAELLASQLGVNAPGGVGMLGDLPLNPGSWCRSTLCVGVGSTLCPAWERHALGALGFTLQDLIDKGVSILPSPKEMSLERIGQSMAALELASEWATQVYNFALAQAQAGHQIPAWVMTLKNGRAKWTENDEAIAWHLELVYGIPRSETLSLGIDTITNVERHLKQAFRGDPKGFEDAKNDLRMKFTIKDASGVKLVPASSGKVAVNRAEMAAVGLNIPAAPTA